MLDPKPLTVFRIICLAICLVTLLVTEAAAQIYYVKEMNTMQLDSLDRSKTVVLLTGGILEEHGPYLPSFTDGYRNERLTQDLADAIVGKPGWSVLIFPTIPLGVGGANVIGGKYYFSGSYPVRSTIMRAILMDLASALGEQGFQWIFVNHVHGSPTHNRVLDQACDYFRDSYGGHMVNLTGIMSLRPPREELPKMLTEKEVQEEGFAVHADAIETSEILFLRPDLVSPAYKFAPANTGRNMDDLVLIAKADGWQGYFGSPRLASAALGAKVWKLYSSRIIDHALKILDGYDYRQLPRYSDVLAKDPTNITIDKAFIEHEQQLESKQSEWLKKKKLLK
jgi:creatinine amidohydrolase/Fe(II)-dependent formamide hydrolase-like protein